MSIFINLKDKGPPCTYEAKNKGCATKHTSVVKTQAWAQASERNQWCRWYLVDWSMSPIKITTTSKNITK